jgi:hypothetical protein
MTTGTCPNCRKQGEVGHGCPTCPGFWFTTESPESVMKAGTLPEALYHHTTTDAATAILQASLIAGTVMNTVYCTASEGHKGGGTFDWYTEQKFADIDFDNMVSAIGDSATIYRFNLQVTAKRDAPATEFIRRRENSFPSFATVLEGRHDGSVYHR